MKLIGIDIGTTTISGIVMEHNVGNNAELIEAKTIANDSFYQLQMIGKKFKMQSRL